MQTQRGRTHYGELDSYRGIAALLIVLLHAYQLPGARIDRTTSLGGFADIFLWNLDGAVDWFFVLSGFLLFLPFARAALGQGESPRAGQFLRRRLVRIVPAYYLTLFLFWSLGIATSPNRWTDLFAHLTFTHIWMPSYMFTTVGTAWSLADEVTYYLLLAALGPILYYLCGLYPTWHKRLRLLLGIVSVLIASSLAYQAHFLWRGPLALGNFPEYFQPLGRFTTFGFGMLLAIGAAATERPLLTGRVSVYIRFLSGSLFALTYFLRLLGNAGIITFPTISGLAFTLLLCSTILGDRGSRWVGILGLQGLRFLGTISYGVYLWHEPIVIAMVERNWLFRPQASAIPANFVITIVLALACGATSYYLVERPSARLLGQANWRALGRQLLPSVLLRRDTKAPDLPIAIPRFDSELD